MKSRYFRNVPARCVGHARNRRRGNRWCWEALEEHVPKPLAQRCIHRGVIGWACLLLSQAAPAAALVRFDKEFLAGVIEKLPPCPFEKADQYRGVVHSYRLVGIDPRNRQFLASCQIEGEFHPPVAGPISERIGRSEQTPKGWRRFRFDVKAKVNIEPGVEGAPRFRVEIEEVKRRELEGFSGVVARFLNQYFDELVTQIARGRASRLNQRLNAEIMRKITVFKEYGVFQGIDYEPNEVVLHFDLTRLRSEGVTGYVFADAKPGTVPLYRWLHPADGSHFYTTTPATPDRPNSVSEGIACHVPEGAAYGAIPLYDWRSPRDHLYTTAIDGEQSGRLGYRPLGIACYIYREAKPGTVPLYRFHDPIRRQHFYTTHMHAEFAK
jgi:hypothetical protein